MVFGINDGESTELASSFVMNFGLTYPVLHDPERTVYFNYNVGGISPYPRDVIVNQDGVIAYVHSEYDPQVMIRTIDELLGLTSIDEKDKELKPKSFFLRAFPNPFNARTTLNFITLSRDLVFMEVFDIRGRQVLSLPPANYERGSEVAQTLNFNGIPSGIYYLRLRNGQFVETKKLVLVR